jgi:hypothetical protein
MRVLGTSKPPREVLEWFAIALNTARGILLPLRGDRHQPPSRMMTTPHMAH